MFDSGFGGLTVARAVIDLLPHEHLVYLGDTGRYPYGPRPLDEVAGFAREICDLLVREHEVKLIVVACNTAASAVPPDELADRFGVPVLSVIEPGVRSLVAATRTGRVGVIGTVGTIRSGSYQRAVAALDAGVELVTAACPGFVEFVERGQTEGEEVAVLAERLLAPVVDAKVDTLLLGCTHYPYLARVIGDVMGRDVVLVSSADETAFELRSRLAGTSQAHSTAPSPARGASPEGAARHTFLSSGDIGWFRDLGRRLLGPELATAEAHRWPAPVPGSAGARQ
jgi:glutamate racemase